jgi:hypothetical protein
VPPPSAPLVVHAPGTPVRTVEPGAARGQAPALAEVVAEAVLAVPGVVRLHGGRFGELATYLPGRRVIGVRVDERGTEVHVVVSGDASAADTGGRIQRAVSAIAPMPVRVHIEDIDTL